MSNFDRMFDIVSGYEGGFTANPADAGNWTGGRVGEGTCRGTKFGISAAAYPDIDIAGLTLDDAKAIYRRDYWERIAGDRLPDPLALLVFDTAVNDGPNRAIRLLQQAAHVSQDGVIGKQTLDAVDHIGAGPGCIAELCSEFLAQRLVFMASLPTWKTFGLGWARRLCKLPYQSLGADHLDR